jgi:membrane fusion protein (multidrug efflux system)
MKSKLYTKLLALLVIAIVVAACNGSSKDKEAQLKDLKAQQAALATQISELEKGVDTKASESGTRRSKEVGVIELTARPFDHYITTQGAIEAVDNILVSAKTMGIITQVFVREGDVVSKGQTLAQIDNSLTLR